MSAHETRHVSTNIALIPALGCVVLMPHVRLLTIGLFADVILDILGTHSYHAKELQLLLQGLLKDQIHVIHLHADQMQFVLTGMVLPHALVFKITLETRMLHVDQNAQLMQTAPLIKHV